MNKSATKTRLKFLFAALLFAALALTQIPKVLAAGSIEVWWPSHNSTLSGTQPFKALLRDTSLSQYHMFWQVDGGQWNYMPDNYNDYPHKEVAVNVDGWTWRGSGPYTLTFIAQDSQTNQIIETRNITITLPGYVQPTATPTPTVAPTATPTPTPTSTATPTPTATPQPPVAPLSGNPFAGTKFYIDPYSHAANQASAWAASRPADALSMQKIASGSAAQWMGEWSGNIAEAVDATVTKARSQGALPVMIAYNIPARDCGGYSAGGSNSASGYKSWIDSFAEGLKNRKAVVVLEPDALANITCLSSTDQQTRYDLISYAVNTLKSAGAVVYLDAGHPGWIDSGVMSQRLLKAGVQNARGFSLNISNFAASADNVAYGQKISALTGGKTFIVDTARNGLGPTSDYQWCNPSGRALGTRSTASTGNALVDAYFWLKAPGESDGTCNGGPSAGSWWAEYALGLAQRAAY